MRYPSEILKADIGGVFVVAAWNFLRPTLGTKSVDVEVMTFFIDSMQLLKLSAMIAVIEVDLLCWMRRGPQNVHYYVAQQILIDEIILLA